MVNLTDTALVEAVQLLQLPADESRRDEMLDAVRSFLAGQSLSASDGSLLIQEALDDWRKSDIPNAFLKSLIPRALGAALTGTTAATMASGYLAWFAKLRAGSDDWNSVSHTTAQRLLSRLPLIDHLLDAEGMSCTQISRLLHALESTLDVPYQAIQVVARGLSKLPTLNIHVAGNDLWEADSRRALMLFPDSALIESCEAAAEEIGRYLPEVDVSSLLQQLSRANDVSEIRWPYLQILHFCCTPVEFFDHPASYLYEFAPRGQIALSLFGRYPAATGNPVLNNAKAVQTLDRAWARNRGGDDAHALVALLEALESLPHVTRREVGRVLRSWIQRVIELETVTPIQLPSDLSAEELERAVLYVAEFETNTQGVIEQRVVDCLALMAFGKEGWRARGIGDSVNASNLSRHKLGDIEFTNVDQRTATALEAHGGHLSFTYVRDHQRSLSRIVEQRLTESWQALDDATAWTIRVLFVAHSRDSDLPETQQLHGVNVSYDYWDYSQLIAEAKQDQQEPLGSYELFAATVIAPLNAITTRQSAREKFLQICGRTT